MVRAVIALALVLTAMVLAFVNTPLSGWTVLAVLMVVAAGMILARGRWEHGMQYRMFVDIEAPWGEVHHAGVAVSSYAMDPSTTAVLLFDMDAGEPLTTLSVNLSQYGLVPPDEEHIFIKGWSEGEGWAEAAEKAGLGEIVSQHIVEGSWPLPYTLFKLTPRAMAEKL